MVDGKIPSSFDCSPGSSSSSMASSASSLTSSNSLQPLGTHQPLISSPTSLSSPIGVLCDNSNPWLDIERGYLLQQQEQDAKDLQRQNQENSWLLKCPPEVISWILFWLADGLEINNLLSTCSLLSRHWISWDWFELSRRRFPNWLRESNLSDLPDAELSFQRPNLVGLAGQGSIIVSNWKRIFVRDAALRRRIALPLPPNDIAQNNVALYEGDAGLLDRTPERPYLHERDLNNLRALLDDPQYFKSDTKTESEKWSRVSSPVYNIDLDSKTTLAASMLARKDEASDQFEFRVLIYALPDLTNPIAICDSKLWTVDQVVDPVVAAARDTRRRLQQQQGQEGLDDIVTEEVQSPQASTATPQQNSFPPTAMTTPGNQPPIRRPWHDPYTPSELPVVQLVELKHSILASTKDKDNNIKGRMTSEMKVMFALAFGQNVGEDDMLLLDVWRLVKIVEITLPSIPRDQDGFVTVSIDSLPPPVLVQVETIDVSAEEDMRARMVKIYTINVEESAPASVSTASPAPTTDSTQPTVMALKEGKTHGLFVNRVLSTQSNVDNIQTANATTAQPTLVTKTCIVIFGIQSNDASAAMMLRKVIFASSEKESQESLCTRLISGGVSCMTLFPYQSGYDRLLVLYNRHGRGMIWDWVNENQVAQLRMPDDRAVMNARPAVVGNVNAAANNNNNNNAQAGGATAPVRRRLSYWGVQVSFTETPNPFTLEPEGRRSFKIVTLADGQEHEWESCFWNVDSLMLGPIDSKLPEQTAFVPIKRHHPLLTGAMRKARDDNMKYIRKWRSDEQTKRDQPSFTAAAITTPTLVATTTSTNTTTAPTSTAAPATTTTTATATPATTTNTAPKPSAPPPAPIIFAINKRFEERTLGIRIPTGIEKWGPPETQQWIESVRASEPVHFNAYVVWNRYRISLTTDQGLVIVDLEETSSDRPQDSPDREWVQYLKDGTDNPLVDIATVNNNLVITQKFGHLVWPFYGPPQTSVT
ncbi:hypothetical protein EMPS_00448 [Entomortierella parvispora]|uniref:Uncharacterized protein n=1 Tax=Entomortierella parvispora TaxID=205924 RepID=A0A9P3H1Q8_9FUNG|nr:hypothetical protein EMPS_00448 [Entomortierella parvispora]